MKIRSRHSEVIVDNWNSMLKDDINTPSLYDTGYRYLNHNIQNCVLESVSRTDFCFLYSNIIISLYREGFIGDLTSSSRSEIEEIEDFLNNKQNLDSDSYLKMKVIVNSFYGKISSFNYPHIKPYIRNPDSNKLGMLSKLVTDYNKLILDELLEKNSDKILYIDTDMIFHTEDLDYGDLDYDKISEKSKFDYLLISDMKRFVYKNGTDFHTKGLRISMRDKVDDRIIKIKEHIRYSNLKKLGI